MLRLHVYHKTIFYLKASEYYIWQWWLYNIHGMFSGQHKTESEPVGKWGQNMLERKKTNYKICLIIEIHG